LGHDRSFLLFKPFRGFVETPVIDIPTRKVRISIQSKRETL
jgi:hypothetical protein